ncbi:unnamed protein product [Withania somnifera]
MELISEVFHGDLNKQWRSRREYHSPDGGKKNIKVARLGGKRSSIWEFVKKRISKYQQVEVSNTNNDFESRLIYEIYKSAVPSMELNPTM